MKRFYLILFAMIFFLAPSVNADVVTFDNNTLASESYWNGSDGSGLFISGDACLMNGYNTSYGSWDGWAYSNTTDTTTPGFANQYSAITGSGANGSSNFGVAYDGGFYGTASPPNLSFGAVTGNDYNTTISGAYFTNTTYAYLSMRDGDSFAKKFGGETGDDADWYKLNIKGIAEDGSTASSVDFFLADFTSADNSLDYIVDDWTWVDLSGLGDVIGLEFTVSSSDNGAYGMNTPAYFAMDDLNGSPVPVPAAVWLLGSGIAALLGFRRKIKF
ncbi:MAG: VPLPA-CTERM sorting domain-containing protein [Desulfobacula sp.]|uniref:DUF4465 domain-containing protein n=1 Tax=Desulfobacula sp. TaxID=2593537 RepID=UPI0025C2BFE1|nr:DUF4465 domain-containing protein [Desulfobacula sp.]MCD4719835.1 VPLPA-CTERM sorting domain-containing protein [Desulfobacula sp.]